MDFRIADTFTDSLARLTGDEQKAAKTIAFDLQMNPAGSGMSFYKLDKAKDKNFWSVRVNADIRLIVHKTQSSLLLRYVDRAGLKERNLTTHAGLFSALASALAKARHPPFDFAVVDQSQDISVAHLRFFAALGADRPNALFFAGDLGQRIFQQPFSWKSLGVDIRGRSRTLRVNYRTSHQIRIQADRLLGPEVKDVDGNTEDRSDTISVFNGPPPVIRVLKRESEEIKSVGAWLAEQSKAGVLPHEFGVFVRSTGQLDRTQAAVKESGLPFKILDEHVETARGHVSISTMHLAKGLEFRAVAVMATGNFPVRSLGLASKDAPVKIDFNAATH